MITPDFAKTMARYNRWQNLSLITAADLLTDAQRWQDRGAVFRSIAETLNHILWDDRVWLARLHGDDATVAQIAARHPYTDTPKDWSIYRQERASLDATLVTWAEGLDARDLAGSTQWIRGTTAVETNVGFNLVHMVIHQTHHRGQVHAMLTQAGPAPGPTDLQMLDVTHGDA
ncbi:MAG: DinB family protein [Pseudomonadota bacterium]